MRRILNVGNIIQTSYTENNYRTRITGTSDCNEYIPVYAISSHKLLVFKDTDIKVMEYRMPTSEIATYSSVRTYDNLIYQLKNAINPCRYNFKLAGVNHNVNIDRGILYDNSGNILMCLGINRDYLFSVGAETLRTNPDYTKFVVFISNLLDDPIYKNVKKKINDLYIDIAKQIGLDIVTTSRINNWLFKNNVKALSFKTVAKLNKHLKEEVPMRILEIV